MRFPFIPSGFYADHIIQSVFFSGNGEKYNTRFLKDMNNLAPPIDFFLFL